MRLKGIFPNKYTDVTTERDILYNSAIRLRWFRRLNACSEAGFDARINKKLILESWKKYDLEPTILTNSLNRGADNQ